MTIICLVWLSTTGLHVVFGASESITDNLPVYSDAQLEAIYQSLPGEQKAVVDKCEPGMRKRVLTACGHERIVKARVKAAKEAARQQKIEDVLLPSPVVPAPYELDPALRQVYDYWSDWRNRRQDECRHLFEDYLKGNPATPFRAEIYYRIAQVYSTNINERMGDTRNIELARAYCQRAHRLYGEKWSYLNMAAWGSLANYNRDFNEKKRYYDWLRRMLKEGTPADIYPFREMGQCAKGAALKFSMESLMALVQNMKENLPMIILSTEKGIFATATEAELEDLARSYPGTELGKQAQMRLERLRSALVKDVLGEFLADSAPSSHAGDRAETLPTATDDADAVSLEADSDVARKPVMESVPLEKGGFWSAQRVLAGAGFAFLAVIFLVAFCRKRRRSRESVSAST